MKIQSFKTVMVLLLLIVTTPIISKVQEFPPENALSTPMDSWLLVVIGVGALYGLVKMWGRNHHMK
jgi:hypothetical protein